MLQKFPQEFKIFFLRELTKELIYQSAPSEVFELANVLEEKEEETKNLEKKEKQQIKQFIKEKEKEIKNPPLIIPRINPQISRPLPVLRIPEPRLPQNLNYLRPTPSNVEISLGALNPLLADSAIRIIECNGPEEKIIVKGTMGSKPTGIVLSKEEIDSLIEKVSQTAKVPLEEGIFRAAVGKIVFSAIISDSIGSRFMIKKI